MEGVCLRHKATRRQVRPPLHIRDDAGATPCTVALPVCLATLAGDLACLRRRRWLVGMAGQEVNGLDKVRCDVTGVTRDYRERRSWKRII